MCYGYFSSRVDQLLIFFSDTLLALVPSHNCYIASELITDDYWVNTCYLITTKRTTTKAICMHLAWKCNALSPEFRYPIGFGDYTDLLWWM